MAQTCKTSIKWQQVTISYNHYPLFSSVKLTDASVIDGVLMWIKQVAGIIAHWRPKILRVAISINSLTDEAGIINKEEVKVEVDIKKTTSVGALEEAEEAEIEAAANNSVNNKMAGSNINLSAVSKQVGVLHQIQVNQTTILLGARNLLGIRSLLAHRLLVAVATLVQRGIKSHRKLSHLGINSHKLPQQHPPHPVGKLSLIPAHGLIKQPKHLRRNQRMMAGIHPHSLTIVVNGVPWPWKV